MKIAITLTSSMHVGQEYIDLTREVAGTLARASHSIVYGGTAYGMMLEVAQSYKKEGGPELIGVMAKDLMAVTKGYEAFERLDAQYLEPTMGGRKEKIISLADGVIALPGGYGTIEELVDYAGGKINKLYDKPIAILNHKGFYNALISFFDELFAKQFSKVRFTDVVFVSEDLESILEHFR